VRAIFYDGKLAEFEGGHVSGKPLTRRRRFSTLSLKMQRLLIAVTGAFLLLAAAAAGTLYLTTPTTLRIAVSADGEDARILTAAATQLVRDRAPYRLELVGRRSPADAGAALDAGIVDLALVRRDLGMPRTGRALVVLRRNVVALIAPAELKLEKISDLRGRRVGVVGRSGINLAVFDAILGQYDIPTTAVRVVPIKPDDIATMVHDDRVDVLMVAGPITGRPMAEAVAAMTRDSRDPTFLGISESKAIAQRTQLYDATEIVSGAFGGSGPPQSIETIGYSHYIVARSNMSEADAGELARIFFEMRPALAQDFPATGRIEAPDTDKGAAVTVHPGAKAYFDGDQKTFFDRYGDYFYYGILALSVVGSALAAVGSFTTGQRKRKSNRLTEPMDIVRLARGAKDTATLDALQERADALLASAVEAAQKRTLDENGMLTFSLVLEHAMSAIRERRAALAQNPDLGVKPTMVPPRQARR